MSGSGLQGHVIEACRQVIENKPDFWLLAALTDYSFEEGTRNASFREPVQTLAAAGAPAPLVADLHQGINGVLSDALRAAVPAATVAQNKSRVPDLLVRGASGDEVAIEVKLLYDLTYTKYYRSAAHDHTKLSELRSGRSATAALAVAFSVQLPEMDYPHGYWYGRPRGSRSRTDQRVRSGSDAQLRELEQRAGAPPSHTVRGSAQLVDRVAPSTLEVASRWFAEVFAPSASWSFQPGRHLVGADVTCAVWEIE